MADGLAGCDRRGTGGGNLVTRSISVGLHGGLGNCLFMLPTIKALSRRGPVDLYVQGDYDILDLFGRCKYVMRALPAVQTPVDSQVMFGQYKPPAAHQSVRWRKLGWPKGQESYPHPEWKQYKMSAVNNGAREIIRDWVDGLRRQPTDIIGIVPGCKPGGEWSRKKWPGMVDLPARLQKEFPGFELQSFGLEEEIKKAGLSHIWKGAEPLSGLPESLGKLRLLIGTDSGVTHLAASIGVPCVVIYTATCPIKGDPVCAEDRIIKLHRGLSCSPCQSTTRWWNCTNWECQLIREDEVVEAAHELLTRFSPADEEGMQSKRAWLE